MIFVILFLNDPPLDSSFFGQRFKFSKIIMSSEKLYSRVSLRKKFQQSSIQNNLFLKSENYPSLPNSLQFINALELSNLARRSLIYQKMNKAPRRMPPPAITITPMNVAKLAKPKKMQIQTSLKKMIS